MIETEDWNGFRIRFIEKDGEWWAVLADICKALGLKNPTVVAGRIDENERAKCRLGRQGNTNIVSERGIYQALFQSRKKEIKDFQAWIFKKINERYRSGYHLDKEESILTEISISKIYADQLTKWKNLHQRSDPFDLPYFVIDSREIDKIRPREDYPCLLKDARPFGYVYIVSFGDKIKIGRSENLTSRMKNLELLGRYGDKTLGSKVFVINIHEDYGETELALHDLFKECRVDGTELFGIDFDFAVSEVIKSMNENKIIINFPNDIDFLERIKGYCAELKNKYTKESA